MGDSESAASKKRVAGRQLTKDNPELDDESPEQEMGTFQRASEEVLATRKIVKVRRSHPSTTSSNPFAGIRLVPTSESNAKPTSPSAQTATLGDESVPEEKKGANDKDEKSGGGKGTESGALVDDQNGIEEGNKKLEDNLDASVKGDAAQLENVDKEAENGGKVTHMGEVKEEIRKKDREETEKDVEEETGKEDREETEKEKLESDKKIASMPAASLSSFRQLSSSQNAFTGLAGTGFGTSSFSFGSIAKEGSTFGASSGSIFGSIPSFGLGSSNNGTSSAPDAIKSGVSGVPPMQEVPTETGEENEKAVFTADAILYEYLDGGWKERGKGELKVNTSISGTEKARLVMRARGNYRLILNASLYPDMTLANMDKKGITFACANSAGDGKDGLTTFALKFKDSSFVEEFRGAVTSHQGTKTAVLKTPENSPKASDD